MIGGKYLIFLVSRRRLTVAILELCYNIRHFELHGRDLEDPWSCRQSALHHNYGFEARQSSFIIIQPPAAFSLSMRDWKPSDISHPMGIHLRYLAAASQGLREYFDYISLKPKKFVSEHKHFHDQSLYLAKTQSLPQYLLTVSVRFPGTG